MLGIERLGLIRTFFSEERAPMTTEISRVIQVATEMAASDAQTRTRRMRSSSREDKTAILSELLFSLWSQANIQQAQGRINSEGLIGPDPNGTIYHMHVLENKTSLLALGKFSSFSIVTMFAEIDGKKTIMGCALNTEGKRTTLLRFKKGKVYEAITLPNNNAPSF